MSGRRILDAAKFLNASSNILKKQVALQKQALDVRTRTSTLTKEAQIQAERISLALKAASELARKFDGDITVPDANEQRRTYTDDNGSKAGVNSAQSGPSTSLGKTSQNINTRANGNLQTSELDINAESSIGAESVTRNSDGDAKISDEAMQQLFRSPKVSKSLFGAGSSKIAPPVPRKSNHAPNIPTAEENLATEVSSTTAPLPTSVQQALKDDPATSPSSSPIDEVADTIPEAESSKEQQNNAPEEVYQMISSRVPSTRLGRLWEYGGLATTMALGAIGESLRRATGNEDASSGSLLLSPANIERLVARLSKMRGAALKVGQMLSFQDSKMLPQSVREILQRVQDKANYMPASQRDKVLRNNLGENWRDLFESFDEVPMAAASIGQVHGAILKENGQRVAVKIQYPGVADSIDSDLNNLAILLTASQLLPKGLYLDKTIANARTELAWECDYIREAECGRKFRALLQDETDTFVVPEIIPHACGKQVLTMERLDGIAVTKINSFTQAQRDWIGTQILRLCFREIGEFRYMQTDPNWTNFLFNAATGRLELLDFGASREYPVEFISSYLRLLVAATRNDREACRQYSIDLGYLTGFESESMVDAHISSMTTIAEPFVQSAPDVYDFSDQTITDRVRNFIPLMLRERLTPPPEETYSLHRKLSGAFLLCARLGSRVRCRELFEESLKNVKWVD